MSHTPQPSAGTQTVAHLLSTPRLAPYLRLSSGKLREAIRLYQWNVEMSGATYEALHVFEVVLRNALDEQLCGWNAAQTDPVTGRAHGRDWLKDPARLLRRLTKDDILKAESRARKALRLGSADPGPAHPDILAQLNLGTWRFLLPDADAGRQLLWRQSLSFAFPHLAEPPAHLVGNVHAVYLTRNRVAHLEPLLNTNLINSRFRQMRAVLGAISPDIEDWFVSRQRMTAVLRLRP